MPRHIGPGEAADKVKHIEGMYRALASFSDVPPKYRRLLERGAAEAHHTAALLNAYERKIRHAHPDRLPPHRS